MRHRELPYFDCTSGRLAPNIDVGVAALYSLVAMGALADANSTTSGDRASLLGSAVLLVGGFGASAVYGYRRTAECRVAKSELADRLNRAAWNRPGIPNVDPWQADGPPPYPAGAVPATPAPTPAPSQTGPVPPPAATSGNARP